MFKLIDEMGCFGDPLLGMVKVNKNVPKSEEEFEISHIDKKLTDWQLSIVASNLVDEGFGNLSRCMSVSRCLNGDLPEARKVLSSFMFNEFID